MIENELTISRRLYVSERSWSKMGNHFAGIEWQCITWLFAVTWFVLVMWHRIFAFPKNGKLQKWEFPATQWLNFGNVKILNSRLKRVANSSSLTWKPNTYTCMYVVKRWPCSKHPRANTGPKIWYQKVVSKKLKLSLETVLISEKDSVNLNELQGHVNNWREIISDFAKGGFQDD